MSNSSRKQSSPNHRLREERDRRSWTHKDVANLINLPDPHTVGRWERGTSFPSAHYRRELCRIFDKTLEELDLLRPLPSEDETPVVPPQQPPEAASKIPASFTSFIGREKEVGDVCTQLRRSDVRLLTLVGAGGIGKTRLAIEVAARTKGDFSYGIYFVPLAALRDASLVISTIATSLGIKGSTTLPSAEQVKAVLREQQALLILDNIEHVATAAPFIEELLASCPGVKVLTTSRQVLYLPAEHVFIVSPLPLPNLKQLPSVAELARFAAIDLFVQRAQTLLPTFKITPDNADALAQLCVRLDGLPLAIELAAARIQLFSPQTLLARLSQDLHILKNDLRTAPDRHRTLYHTMKWSYDLLDVDEQRLFRHLAIFVGGATLETIENFFHADPQNTTDMMEKIFSLLNKSLLHRIEQEHGEPRFTMLETIRDFGMDCLRVNGELEECMQVYATYFLQLVELARPQLTGSQQERWLTTLEEEHDNLRAALGWLIERQKTELALRFCEACGKFWGLRGYWSEERRWLKAALHLPQELQQLAIRGRVLRRAGHLAYRLRDLTDARTLLEQSVVCSRQIGDQHNLAGALSSLGWVFYRQNEIVSASALLKESVDVARTLDDNWVRANTLESLGRFMHYQGDLARADALLAESVAIARTLVDKENLARILTTLVVLEIAQGHMPQAELLAQESSALARELGAMPLIALTLDTLGEVALFQGTYEQARQHFEQRIAMAYKLGDIPTVVGKQLKLADIALAQRDLEQAAQSAQTLLQPLRERGNTPGVVTALCILADIKRIEGNIAQALMLYQDALRQGKNVGDKRSVGRCIAGLAQALLEQGQLEQAADLFANDQSWLNSLYDMYPVQRADYTQAKKRAQSQWNEIHAGQAWPQASVISAEMVPGSNLRSIADT